MSSLKQYTITNCWSFIGMDLLKQYTHWYEIAQVVTNKAPTSKGKSPYT